MGPCPSRHPSRLSKAPFLEPSRIGTVRPGLHLSRSRSLYKPFSSFSPCRLSPVVYSSSSSRGLLLPRRAATPFVSVSRDHLDHPLLGSSHSAGNRSPFSTFRTPSSILPSRSPGFYLSLASTRSLSGNERRNTLATFNRPALSSAYTYLAGSALLLPSFPTHAFVLISILPPSCHPRPSAHPRRAPTSRFLLLIFTTNIVYKYLRALSLVFRAFRYAHLGRCVCLFSPKN